MVRFNYPLRPELIQALSPPENLMPSVWLERHVIIPNGPRPGRLRLDPWQKAIIDDLPNRDVIYRSLMCGSQVGKSTLMAMILIYSLFYLGQSAMIVFATGDTATRFLNETLYPIIDASSVLSASMSSEKKRKNNQFKLKTGTLCHIATAGSQASLASVACACVVLDEVALYGTFEDNADPVNLAKDRLGSFLKQHPVLIAVSTPKHPDDPICHLIDNSIQHDWMMQCPHCGAYDKIVFENITRKHDDVEYTIAEIDADPSVLKWRCLTKECGHTMEESEYMLHSNLGKWMRNEKQDVSKIPKNSVGYRLPGMMSRSRDFKEIVIRHILAGKNVDDLRSWKTSIIGEPFSQSRSVVPIDKLKKLIIPELKYKGLITTSQADGNMIPQDTMAITVGIDVGRSEKENDYHFWVCALATLPNRQYVVVGADRILSIPSLLKFLQNPWFKPDGKMLQVKHAFIDSQGSHATSSSWRGDILKLCSDYSIIDPIIGRQTMLHPISDGNWNPKNEHAEMRDIMARLKLYILWTTHFKDDLHLMMNTGSLKFSNGFKCNKDGDEELFIHINNEAKEEVNGKLIYVPKYEKAPQHLWDALVYAMASSFKNGLQLFNTWDQYARIFDPATIQKQQDDVLRQYMTPAKPIDPWSHQSPNGFIPFG